MARWSLATCHPRTIHNVWHSTSVQPFYLRCDSGWVDVPNCDRNCQLAVSDNQPIPHSLAIILGHLMGNDAAGRRTSGPHDSICLFSSDKRRIAPIPGLRQGKQCPLWVKSGHIAVHSCDVRSTPKSGHHLSLSGCPLCAKSGHPAPHSITSSARASSEGVTVRPSAFAVVRLITIANLVDCRTGRSAGLAPLRI